MTSLTLGYKKVSALLTKVWHFLAMPRARRSSARPKKKLRGVTWLDYKKGKPLASVCEFNHRHAPRVVGLCVIAAKRAKAGKQKAAVRTSAPGKKRRSGRPKRKKTPL